MIKTILAIVDNGISAAPFLRDVAAHAELSAATLEVAVLTPAPMARNAAAPFGSVYVPEYVLIGEDAANIADIETALAYATCEKQISGFHDDVAWLAGDLRRSRHVADVIAIGATETWNTPWLRRRIAQTMVRAAGSPIVLLPEAIAPRPIIRAVVGWKPSPEATRAVHALVALAEPGATIDIVTVGDTVSGCERDHDGHAAIKRFLQRHGFDASDHWIVNPDKSEAEVLSLYAKETKADILAIGGFAHSRIRDIVLGGVTRDLIERNYHPILVTG